MDLVTKYIMTHSDGRSHPICGSAIAAAFCVSSVEVRRLVNAARTKCCVRTAAVYGRSVLMPDVVMTNHSVKRTKERIGLSKKIADKNAQRALEYGVTHSEAKGGLCRYLDKLYLSNGNANNVRIYHRYVYLFRGNTLLTIIPLPNKFYALADKLQKQKGEAE